MNPSTEDILRQINATPAEIVFVLPNNKNIIMAAEQCRGLAEGKEVVVIPSKTVPQGIATLLVMDPDGAGMIKRVSVESVERDFRLTLYSDNAINYPPVMYSLKKDYLDDWDRAIVGRVIWAWSDVREK